MSLSDLYLYAVLGLLVLVILLAATLFGMAADLDRLRRAARLLAQHQLDDAVLSEAFDILQGRG